MADYRHFNKNDWDAFAGAEKFSNGADPFICVSLYGRSVDNEELETSEVDIIASKTGIEVYIIRGDEEDDLNVWTKTMSLTEIKAEGELKHLIRQLKQYDNVADIAYALSHTEGFTQY